MKVVEKRNESILNDFRGGESLNRICFKYGVSKPLLTLILKQNGIDASEIKKRRLGKLGEKYLHEDLFKLGIYFFFETKRLGYSEKDLRDAFSISGQELARIMSGCEDLKFSKLKKMATLMGVSLSELFNEIEKGDERD